MDEEFIHLADGSRVYKDGRIVAPPGPSPAVEEAPTHVAEFDPSRLVFEQRKKLSDLPETPARMNGLSAILAYSLFGLDDDEIAAAIGTTPDRIAGLRLLSSYATLRDEVIRNVLSAEQSDVRDLFVQHARTAVHTVVEGMNAKKVADRLRAAGDILDRSGYRPVDVVEHRHRLEGGLTIEIVRKEHSPPVIDLDLLED